MVLRIFNDYNSQQSELQTIELAANLARLDGMTDAPTARDTAALVDLLYVLMRRLWDHAEGRLAPYSLSLKHNWALHALDEPMSMSALADRMGIDASYVTTIADQLEERGLIERRPHPTDRRVKSLALTAEGRRLRDQLAEELWIGEPMLEALTDAERDQLRALVTKAVDTPPGR